VELYALFFFFFFKPRTSARKWEYEVQAGSYE